MLARSAWLARRTALDALRQPGGNPFNPPNPLNLFNLVIKEADLS
jgi:hypothetical protein